MKTNCILSCAALCLSTCAAFGQGCFDLANKHTPIVDAPVFDAMGVPLAGMNFRAELWGAATPDSLTPLMLIDRGNSREIVPFLDRGYFIPTTGAGNLCVTTVPPGGSAWLQVRAWDARLGDTYEQVLALGIGGYGESPLFYAQGGNPYDLLGLPSPLIGLQSFSLREVIPEPATWVLLVCGGIGLWWAARRHTTHARHARHRQ